eukprot:15474754-Alexandrium_andersonii.AAC.2
MHCALRGWCLFMVVLCIPTAGARRASSMQRHAKHLRMHHRDVAAPVTRKEMRGGSGEGLSLIHI